MGKVKIYRQNIVNLIHSVSAKSLFSLLCYDNQHKFGLDPSESKIVAYKSFSYILTSSKSRTGEQIIFPLLEGRNSHQKKSYSSSSKKDVILTVYSHDDLLLLREFGLKEMQNSRIARLMEEAHFQDAIFTLDTLSLLTNISLDSLRERLHQWNLSNINLCVSGQSIKSRGGILRASYLIKSFLKGEDLLSIRKFLCYSEDSANNLLINFVRVYSRLRDGLSPTRISATATISQHIIEQWCSLIGEFEKLYLENLSMLEDYFKIQAASTVKSNADSIHHQLVYELKELHNFSPAKTECYMHYLLDHCNLLDSIERHPQDIIYYAVSQFEPPSNPLSQCQLLTCKIRFIDIENDFKLLSRGRVYDLKWIKILRYSTQSRSYGAVLSSYDLAFLLGVDDSVITQQLKDHPNVFVPTRGNVIDTGPALTHVEKIITLFMEGYTETEIMTRTGHSRESVENYMHTFCIAVGLIERGIPLPLIRQITKRSKRLIELHKSLYDRFNVPNYQFTLMRVRSIFAQHEQLKSKKNSI